MKKKSFIVRRCMVIRKISLAVCVAATLCLAGKTIQLMNLYFSKAWFTAAQWEEAFRYPAWAKCLFVIQILSLITFIAVSRIKKQNSI